jgi:hypothetical protein
MKCNVPFREGVGVDKNYLMVEDLNGDTEFYEDEWDTESAPASP